jgi:transcriptional antiterminator RfaH
MASEEYRCDCEHWFAIQVKLQYEQFVAKVLNAKGFEAFSPTYRRLDSDRGEEKSEPPLFPGYLFGLFNVRFRLPILTTPGVHRVVGYGKNPVPIPPEEIKAIQEVTKFGPPPEPCPFLETGTRVQVIKGPLTGVEGILIETRSRCRVVLSVSLIQQSIRVEVDRQFLRILHSSQPSKLLYHSHSEERRNRGNHHESSLQSN